MSFSATCDWTLARSVVLVLLAWPVCRILERAAKASTHPTALLLLLSAPFLMPELLLGYLLAPWVVGFPWRSELAVTGLLFLRSVPVGVIALCGTPASPVSPAAIHVRRMCSRGWQDRWHLARCYVHGPLRRAMPALGLMFLMTFQEFEAAALLGSVSWTDRLFTEHATGLPLSESLQFLRRPLLIQAVVLWLVLWSAAGLSWSGTAFDQNDSPTEVCITISWWYAGVVCALGVLALWLQFSGRFVEGWTWLSRQPAVGSQLGTEICTAGLVGAVSGLMVWTLARGLLSKPLPLGIAAVCSLPGLCGGLTVSLGCMWLSARPEFQWVSATPVWWVMALTVWLLPRAVLLQLWLRQRTQPESHYLIELLRHSPQPGQREAARRWRWRWQIEPQIAGCGVLCYLAYLDLTAAALLAPPGMASIMVRLYNFMHFGHSAAMSMAAALALLAPLCFGAWIMAAVRVGRWGWRS